MRLEVVAEGELALGEGVVLLAGAGPVAGEVVLRLSLVHVLQTDGLRVVGDELRQFAIRASRPRYNKTRVTTKINIIIINCMIVMVCVLR